jgi:hypothetical protein
MLRTTIPAVVALVCLGVVGEAQAQTAGSGFGSLGTSGQFIISGERLTGLHFWSVKTQDDPTPADPNPNVVKDSGTAINLLWGGDTAAGSASAPVYSVPRIGLDFVVIPNLTVGASVGYIHRGSTRDTTSAAGVTVTDDHRPSGNGFLLNPRVGYVIGLTPTIAIWARGGLTYFYAKTTDENVNGMGVVTSTNKFALDGFALSLDPQVVFAPAPHFGVTLGPVLDLPLAGSSKNENTPMTGGMAGVTTTTTTSVKITNFGLIAGLAGYF